MKSILLFLATGVILSSLAACGQPPASDPSYYAQYDTAICVDRYSGYRLPDARCDNPYHRYRADTERYYIPVHHRIPYYGQRPSGGGYQRLSGHVYSAPPLATAKPYAFTAVDGVLSVSLIKRVPPEKPSVFTRIQTRYQTVKTRVATYRANRSKR